MMKRLLILSVVLLALTAFYTHAYATLLDYSSEYFLGSIDDGIQPSEYNQTSWLNQLIGMERNTTEGSTDPIGETLIRSNNIFTDLPTAYFSWKDESPNNETIIANYDYVIGKYGGGVAKEDKDGGISLVWYIGSSNDSFNMINTHNGFGLSHISYFNNHPVPEPETMLLFGIGLLGLAGVSRKKQQV